MMIKILRKKNIFLILHKQNIVSLQNIKTIQFFFVIKKITINNLLTFIITYSSAYYVLV